MITIRQGNDYAGTDRIVLTFTDADTGDPIDLTGSDLQWAIKRKRTTPDDDAYILKTTTDLVRPVEIDADPTLGLAYVTLTAEETAAIPRGAWWHGAQGIDGTDRHVEVAPSRVTVEGDFIVALTV